MANNNSNMNSNRRRIPAWQSKSNWCKPTNPSAPSTSTTKQHLISGRVSGPAAGTIRPTEDSSEMLKIRVEKFDQKRKLQESGEEQKPAKRQQQYMIVTDTMEITTLDNYRAEIAKEADVAYQPACQIGLQYLVPQDNERVFNANTQAGDLIQQLGERVDEMKQIIARLQKERDEAKAQTAEENDQLKISPKDQTYLMTRYLHHRYRTLWQIGRNTRRIPDRPRGDETDHRRKELHDVIFPEGRTDPSCCEIPWQRHKDRFDLASCLGHMGDLKADLLAGTSEYFARWHGSLDIKLKDHAKFSKNVHERIFKTVYNLSFEEAKWLVETSENGEPALKTVVTWARRLIERCIYVIDQNYKNITKGKSTKTGVQFKVDTKAPVYGNLQHLERVYNVWTNNIKTLIQKILAAGSVEAGDIDQFNILVNGFWKAIEPIADRKSQKPNKDTPKPKNQEEEDDHRGESIGWYKWSFQRGSHRARTQMARFKPADVLQLDYMDDDNFNKTF